MCQLEHCRDDWASDRRRVRYAFSEADASAYMRPIVNEANELLEKEQQWMERYEHDKCQAALNPLVGGWERHTHRQTQR